MGKYYDKPAALIYVRQQFKEKEKTLKSNLEYYFLLHSVCGKNVGIYIYIYIYIYI